MDYLTIKALHMWCAGISISFFTLRGSLQLAGVNWRRWRLLRIAPHLVDTVLLSAAIWLATLLQQIPFVHGWLTAKVLSLIAYILLGKLALKADQPPLRAALAFAAALLCVAYIVAVAITHSASLGLITGT
jgi:uncharacterized membrane protein SirB2